MYIFQKNQRVLHIVGYGQRK